MEHAQILKKRLIISAKGLATISAESIKRRAGILSSPIAFPVFKPRN